MFAAAKESMTESAQKKPMQNLTGIPAPIKQRFEAASGFSLDDVRVHYNSDKPRRIGALAYTQGTQVHIGPGQQRYLTHELGHVVQQKAGFVRANASVHGMPLNCDPQLERAASHTPTHHANTRTSQVIQRAMDWDKFFAAFALAGKWLDAAAINLLNPGAQAVFHDARIRYTEKIGYHIIGSVSKAYNTVQQILSSHIRGALAWVNPTINTIINISEDHVADDPTEDVATTILHELSHYDTSLGTDDIAYMYTMEEFEENIHGLTYGTAALNADSIAFLIRALAQL